MNAIKRWWYNTFGSWKKRQEVYATLTFEVNGVDQKCKGLVYIEENEKTGARRAIAEEPDGTTHRISLSFAETKFDKYDDYGKIEVEKEGRL